MLNVPQILNDIESGRLTIRPDKICWEILKDENPCASVYDYVFILRTQAYYDRVDPDFLVREYMLNENGIDMQDKEKAAVEIYTRLMAIVEDEILKAVDKFHAGTHWYKKHRFTLRCQASALVDDIICQKVRFAGDLGQIKTFCTCLQDIVQGLLVPEEEK